MTKNHNRKVLSLFMTFAMLVSLFVGLTINAAAADYTMTYVNSNSVNCASGDTVSIGSATELGYFATYVNTSGKNTSGVTFNLTGSITLSGSWTPVGIATISTNGTTSSPYVSAGDGFAGTFNGNEYTISGLSVTASSSGAGLFKYVAPAGIVKNLTVSGTVSASSAYDAIGGVVGYNSGIINNVDNSATVTASSAYNVGGIAGFNDNYYTSGAKGAIVNCSNSGAVTGYNKVGGITGENAGIITFCYNSAAVTSASSGKLGVGGIAGRNGNNNTAVEIGSIYDCYNTGAISIPNGKWCGGIAGFQDSLSLVKNCYNRGTVSAYGNYNHIIGNNESSRTTVDDNYRESSTSGTGTTSENGTFVQYMQTAAFYNTLEASAYEADIWTGGAGVYPTFGSEATVPTTSTSSNTNSYSVIYLSSSGDDDNDGGTLNTAVATLGKAVAQADLSTVSTVYVSVRNTITISDAESVFGNDTAINWDGSTDPMFIVDENGSLTIGGLAIDGDSVSTVFSVAEGGTLAVRNNSSISDCATAISVASGGSLVVNQSSITGSTNSVYMASSTDSSFTMSAASSQTITLSGNVYLGTGTTITLNSALTSSLTIQCTSPAVGLNVANADDSTIAAASYGYFHYYNNSNATFTYSGTEINIATL